MLFKFWFQMTQSDSSISGLILFIKTSMFAIHNSFFVYDKTKSIQTFLLSILLLINLVLFGIMPYRGLRNVIPSYFICRTGKMNLHSVNICCLIPKFGNHLFQINRFFWDITILSFFSDIFRLNYQNEFNRYNKSILIRTKYIHNSALKSSHYKTIFILNNQISNYYNIFQNTHKSNIYRNIALFLSNSNIKGVSLECENENIPQGRSFENENVYICNCFFSRSITFLGNGGVIYISGVTLFLDASYSMFYNCSAKIGGAIYLSAFNSSLRRICANRCSCGMNSGGHFSQIAASMYNHVEFLSVLYCSHTPSSGSYSTRLNTGNQSVVNTNSSTNNGYQVSGFSMESPSSFTCSFCTFSNNKVSNSMCIYLYFNSGTVQFSNIIQNESPSYGIFFVNGGSPKMSNCIFQNNQNTLFYVNSGSLEVLHSLIGHSGKFSSKVSIITLTNNSFTSAITYQIHFFNSIFCHADFPIVELHKKYTIDQTHMRSFSFQYSMIVLLIARFD